VRTDVSPKIDIDEGAGDHTIELPLGEVALADRMRTDAVGTPCLVVLGGLDLGASLLLDIPEVVVGRDPECHHVLSDDGISRRHASFTWNGRGYDITDLDSTNGVFVNGERVTTATLREGDKILLGQSTVLKYTRQDDFELEYQRRLHESLSRDALTGAMNRRFLEERLLSEWSFAMRHGTQLSLLVLDVDHFKRVNDTHGHPTGDAVLKGIVEAIGSTIRKEDVLGRYGGEEFVVIVRGVGHDGALRLARRIRASIASARFVHGRTLIPVTVSIGVATAAETSGESHEKLLALADERLFEAKRSGRDRVVG
jgi:diguanylate cyclase (GGDEF)-like protein